MTTEGMHREDIKAAIRKKGMTMSALSLANDLDEATVRKSLQKPIPRANKAISAFLKKPLHKLWPDWYDKRGQRIRSSSIQAKPSRSGRPSHCQKSH